ncbi:MAG: hypothetical protein AABY28_01585 [Candidatus Omnitrophota bacterium]
MKTFAFIVNPVTIKELKNYWPSIRILPDAFNRFDNFSSRHIYAMTTDRPYRPQTANALVEIYRENKI